METRKFTLVQCVYIALCFFFLLITCVDSCNHHCNKNTELFHHTWCDFESLYNYAMDPSWHFGSYHFKKMEHNEQQLLKISKMKEKTT